MKKKSVSRKKPARRKNGALNAAQAEQLIIMLEESAAVIQVAAKLLRFGLNSCNPHDPKRTPNHKLLENEIGDFEGTVEKLKKAGFGITTAGIRKARSDKLKRMQRWLMNG